MNLTRTHQRVEANDTTVHSVSFFTVLKEADLVHAEKTGKSVIYHLKLLVLEEALLGFVHSLALAAPAPKKPKKETAR